MPSIDDQHLHNRFEIKINKDWSFTESRSTESYTHNYHRYPAKFIPQIVKKLIETYTNEGDKIADLFAGCGTTLVESKIHGRESVGVDINPVAKLITEAKINPIKPQLLLPQFSKIKSHISRYIGKTYHKSQHLRIDYWFRRKEKNKIAFLYYRFLRIKNAKIRIFFLCALSNILRIVHDGSKIVQNLK